MAFALCEYERPAAIAEKTAKAAHPIPFRKAFDFPISRIFMTIYPQLIITGPAGVATILSIPDCSFER